MSDKSPESDSAYRLVVLDGRVWIERNTGASYWLDKWKKLVHTEEHLSTRLKRARRQVARKQRQVDDWNESHRRSQANGERIRLEMSDL